MTNDPKLHFKFAHITSGLHILHSYICIGEKLCIFKNRYYMMKCDILFRKWWSTGMTNVQDSLQEAPCPPSSSLSCLFAYMYPLLRSTLFCSLGGKNKTKLFCASFWQRDPFPFSPTTQIQPIDIRTSWIHACGGCYDTTPVPPLRTEIPILPAAQRSGS